MTLRSYIAFLTATGNLDLEVYRSSPNGDVLLEEEDILVIDQTDDENSPKTPYLVIVND